MFTLTFIFPLIPYSASAFCSKEMAIITIIKCLLDMFKDAQTLKLDCIKFNFPLVPNFSYFMWSKPFCRINWKSLRLQVRCLADWLMCKLEHTEYLTSSWLSSPWNARGIQFTNAVFSKYSPSPTKWRIENKMEKCDLLSHYFSFWV